MEQNPERAEPIFLAVGRFTEKKAPLTTISAFAGVHSVFPEARLRMIGDGPLLAAARALAQSLGIAQEVLFLGSQDPATVQREMRQARCFVQHSVEAPSGDCEGTPVSILEACATGLPVVSTRHGGIIDVVLEGKSGYLVAERDVDGMSARMLSVISQPELAADLGKRAQQQIRDNHSQEQSLAHLWSIIESCLTHSPGRETIR